MSSKLRTAQRITSLLEYSPAFRRRLPLPRNLRATIFVQQRTNLRQTQRQIDRIYPPPVPRHKARHLQQKVFYKVGQRIGIRKSGRQQHGTVNGDITQSSTRYSGNTSTGVRYTWPTGSRA